MPCDVKTIIQGAVAQGYEGLEDRSFLLSMAGALTTSTGLNASQSVTGAKNQGYYGLSDRALDEALLAALCPSIVPPVPPPSTGVTFTAISPTTVSIAAPVPISIIGTNFDPGSTVQIRVRIGGVSAGALAIFVSSTTLTLPNTVDYASVGVGVADVEYNDFIGNDITLPAALTIIA